MTGIYIDTVFHPGGVRMAALIAGFDPNEPALKQAPFDPRFANVPFITTVLKGCLKTAEKPVAWISQNDKDQSRSSIERLVDLVEWAVWVALESKRLPDIVVISSHPGVIGDADVPSDIVLLRRADLDLIVRRVFRDAPKIGIDIGNKYPEIKSIPYGMPQTLQGMIAARHLCALPDGYAEKNEGVPALRGAPLMEEMALIRHCVADVLSTPPSVLSIARGKVHFERNTGDPGAVGASMATNALDKACGIISAGVSGRIAETALREITGQIQGVLEARQGDYEACEEVLSRLWDEKSPGKSTLESALGSDPYLFAEALILRAHIANHRGDVAKARTALKKAMAVSDHENSLRMLLLKLKAATLSTVAAQNQWPFEAKNADAIAAVREASETLNVTVEKAGLILDVMNKETSSYSKNDAPMSGTKNEVKDPSFGAALGTLGRCCAFLGLHKEATDCLEHATRHFISSLDLSLNASFLLHIEFDRPGGPDANKVNALFNRILPVENRSPGVIVQSILNGNPGICFSMDLLLKALLANASVEGVDLDKWHIGLSDGKKDGLFQIFSGMHSHPTELIGRHAGELLRKTKNETMARQWFELGILVGNKGGETMQRLAMFTKRLLDGKGPDLKQPIGSIFNPNFEYR